MSSNQKKQLAAQAAFDALKPNLEKGMVLGIGTGSTTNAFIDLLASHKSLFKATVASSIASAKRLTEHGIEVVELNSIGSVPFYIDGADEIDDHLNMVKGGGGALTQEKIIAACADTFYCIANRSKLTKILGNFPLPIEVIPMARSYVARELLKMGGNPVFREGFKTDNGHIILDIHDLHISEPLALETKINAIAGVVASGLFAHRGADKVFLATNDSVETITR